MRIASPAGTSIYIFGSALHSETPRDLDVLVVYDPAQISPAAVYERMQPTFLELQARTGLSVHPTLLTMTEMFETRFSEQSGCIEVASWHGPDSPRLATKAQRRSK
jgi:hypothetical protein